MISTVAFSNIVSVLAIYLYMTLWYLLSLSLRYLALQLSTLRCFVPTLRYLSLLSSILRYLVPTLRYLVPTMRYHTVWISTLRYIVHTVRYLAIPSAFLAIPCGTLCLPCGILWYLAVLSKTVSECLNMLLSGQRHTCFI